MHAHSVAIVKTVEIFTRKSCRPWRRPSEPRRTLQFAGPQPSFCQIGHRSVRSNMHGNSWMASLLHSGGCGRCCSAIRACAVMRRLAHGLRCRDRHARPTATTRRSACVSRPPLSNDSRWRSESTHRPKARVSATETPASWRFGTQLHYLSCYVNAPPDGYSSP